MCRATSRAPSATWSTTAAPPSTSASSTRSPPRVTRAWCWGPVGLRRQARRKESPTQPAPDAGGDGEMALVVAGEAQHDVAGARVGVALDPGGGSLLGPREAALALAGLGGRHAVIAREIVVHPGVGA